MSVVVETQELVKNRLLRTQQEVEQFEKAVANILSIGNIEHIENLCLGFHDETENDEVMFGLVHAIESYDKKFDVEKSLYHLAKAIPSMLPHAKEWAKILHKRILNNTDCRVLYARIISTADKRVKEVVITLLNEIMLKNRSKFETLVLDFLARLKDAE